MNKLNPLAGLVGYADSDDDSDDGAPNSVKMPDASMASAYGAYPEMPLHPPGVQPAPISHCPWSACYDESSGFTYYWNQLTNAVTWEAPPEYLLALKVAQQQMHAQGPSEVSAEEWQLYQQVLAEKQSTQGKGPAKPASKPGKKSPTQPADNKTNAKKRRLSDVEEEKIELITSYHNSDSESNDETDSPVKAAPPPPAKISKNGKKAKSKPVMQYGPTLPPNQNYTIPIGPEMPPELQKVKVKSPKSPDNKIENIEAKLEESQPNAMIDNEDSQDESALLIKLKDKAELLERLGGEIPSEIHKIIYDDNQSTKSTKAKKSIDAIDNIDDLLSEIEKKELPKIKSKKNDKLNDVDMKSIDVGDANSPKSAEVIPLTATKPLFPSIKNIPETDINLESMNTMNSDENKNNDKSEVINVSEKKGANLYLMNSDPAVENIQRKKLRISNSVLPDRKRNESPVYTTKYAQSIDGFAGECTGLGFNKEDPEEDSSKNLTSSGNTISYGKGLTFTKGETLNEEKKDDDLDDLTELVLAKLKYLNQLQPCPVTPLQEMLIQMQTLREAWAGGALGAGWWRRRARAAERALHRHEAAAAPTGWTLAFQRSEGRYQYRRESDGLVQWEYPAVADTDMDICTTPPHPGIEGKEEPPPLPCSPVRSAPPPPPPVVVPPPAAPVPPVPAPPGVMPVVPAPPPWRAQTPPPPTWSDPPPPGCDDLPPLPESKREIGDELMSFYNDIAELEKNTLEPPTASNSPEPAPPVVEPKEKEKEKEKKRHREEKIEKEMKKERERAKEKDRDRQKDKDRDKTDKESKVTKKKSKVKISTSMGLKHKSVSSLVAKWQQVAEEINSD